MMFYLHNPHDNYMTVKQPDSEIEPIEPATRKIIIKNRSAIVSTLFQFLLIVLNHIPHQVGQIEIAVELRHDRHSLTIILK
jgi:hypothetical protein